MGVGFSHSDKIVDTEEELSNDALKFMRKFYDLFPDQKPLDFIIAGESYAGRYIPHIANTFVKSKEVPIKSIMIGNGLVDIVTQ